MGQAVAAGLADGAIVCTIIPVFGPEIGGALGWDLLWLGYTSDLFLADDEGPCNNTDQELLNKLQKQ